MRGIAGLAGHPLVPVAVGVAAGTAVGAAHPSQAGAIACGVTAAVLVLFAAASRRWRFPLAVAAVICAAICRSAMVHSAVAASERDFALMCESDRFVSLYGEVAAVYGGQAAGDGRWRHIVAVRDCNWRTLGEKRPIRGRVLLEWYAQAPEGGGPVLARGDKVEATGHVHARGGRDGAGAVALKNVRLVAYAASTRVRRDSAPANALGRFRRDAASILSLGTEGYREERELVLAMVLGLRSSLPARMREAFRRAGTIHVFAISGLHVGAIAMMLAALLSFMGISRTYVVIPLAPMMAAYVFMTGLQPSAMRAALMVSIYYFAIMAGREPSATGAVSIALIAILACNPLAVSETGFILSFAMVSGMIAFTGPVTNVCAKAFGTRRLAMERALALAAEAGGDRSARTRRWARDLAIGAWSVATRAFAAALSAALVSFPLTAYMFDSYVPYSIFANMVVVPLAFPVMAVSGTGLILSAVSLKAAAAANFIAVRMARVMRVVSEGVASMPNSTVEGTFPLWGLALWYAVLLALLRGLPGTGGPLIGSARQDTLEGQDW